MRFSPLASALLVNFRTCGAGLFSRSRVPSVRETGAIGIQNILDNSGNQCIRERSRMRFAACFPIPRTEAYLSFCACELTTGDNFNRVMETSIRRWPRFDFLFVLGILGMKKIKDKLVIMICLAVAAPLLLSIVIVPGVTLINWSIIAATSFAFALMLGAAASRSIERSLTASIDRVKRLERGETDLPPDTATQDEFATLTRHISETAQQINQRLHDVVLDSERRIEESRLETERACAARIQELDEKLLWYVGMFEDAPVGYHEVDSEGIIIRINQTELSMLGYEEREVVGRHAAEFTTAEQSVRERLAAVIAGTLLPTPSERDFVRKDGSLVTVMLQHNVTRNAKGDIVGMRSAVQDLSVRKRMEEALASEKDLLHTLMDTIPDCIYFKDAHGCFTRVNKAQADLMGAESADAVTGKSDREFFNEDYVRDVASDERRIFELGTPLIGKIEKLETSTDKTRWLSTTKVPIKQRGGGITGLVGISRDVTDQKLAEEQFEANLNKLLGVVSKVAAGDLTLRGHEGSDTLGRIARSLNAMLLHFSGMIAKVQELAITMSSSSSQIVAAADEMAEGAHRQAEETNTTSSAVEEMAASMAQVSRHATSSAEAANNALAMAQLGDDAVRKTADAINRIHDAVIETAGQLETLALRSSKITEMMDLIDDIAEQTNLLAVNAAIQAAHAGDAGLGFSVVAEEIRKLAERSARTTKDVNMILKSVDRETRAALAAMERGSHVVTEGISLGENARRSLEAISASVTGFTILMDEIAASSEEQALATRNVSDAMHTISSIGIETAAGSRETAAIIESANTLSQKLNDAISQFKI
jgi:PAS domain S-box-containing protein